MSVANSRMKIFENRQLQLESKPNNQTAGSLVKPPEDEVKSFKVPLKAWTHHASSQLNPNRDQTFNISTNFSEQNQCESWLWAQFQLGSVSKSIITSSLIETEYLCFKESKVFRIMGRPILMQTDLRLLPWQICMLPRDLLLSHTQMSSVLGIWREFC